MYKEEKVDADLRNINPASFSKMETFLIEKIEYELKMDGLDNEMKGIESVLLYFNIEVHYNNLAKLNKNRLLKLKEKLLVNDLNEF